MPVVLYIYIIIQSNLSFSIELLSRNLLYRTIVWQNLHTSTHRKWLGRKYSLLRKSRYPPTGTIISDFKKTSLDNPKLSSIRHTHNLDNFTFTLWINDQKQWSTNRHTPKTTRYTIRQQYQVRTAFCGSSTNLFVFNLFSILATKMHDNNMCRL